MNNEEKVTQAYKKKSKNFRLTDKRKRWDYVTSKILTDQRLLYNADFYNKKILNIGCAPHPIDELFFLPFIKLWISSDNNFDVLLSANTIIKEECSNKLVNKQKSVLTDASKLGFKTETFDIVCAFSTIEHLSSEERRKDALKEIYRVIKKGGYLIITVPNKLNFPYVIWSLRQQKLHIAEFGYETFYTPFEMKKILKSIGFEPVSFASNFSFTPEIWCKFLKYIDIAKFFGYRIGYLVKK